MYESCPRCGAPLQPLEGATPAFCASCGLPQLRVSSDVLQGSAAAEVENDAVGGILQTDHVDWSRALRVIGLVGLLGVVPASLLPGALVAGEVGGLVLLMTPLLALGAVFGYGRSRPAGTVSAAGGTRMGALLGLWMGALTAAITGVAGYVLRYGYHSRAMDEKMDQAVALMPAQLQAAGSPPPPELLAFLHTPEFRAGTFILGHVFTVLLLVVAGSVCGWMAATMLRARRQRSID